MSTVVLPSLVAASQLNYKFSKDRCIIHKFNPRGNGGSKGSVRKERWEFVKELGSGTFGSVWLQRCFESQSDLLSLKARALKTIQTGDDNRIDWVRELETIIEFSHPQCEDHFVTSSGWFQDNNLTYIVMEYLEHGDMQKYMRDSAPLPESEVREITHQLLEGLRFMHGKGFAHRDLKLSNILIKEKPPNSWWVKIGDFGLSKRVGGIAQRPESTIKGTPGYMAPEIRNAVYDRDTLVDPIPADMWSLGEIMFRMLTKTSVFNGERAMWSYVEDLEKELPLPQLAQLGCSSLAIHFFIGLMARSPDERLTSEQAYNHKWMTEFRTPPSPSAASDSTDSDSFRDLDLAMGWWRASTAESFATGSGEWTNLESEASQNVVNPLPARPAKEVESENDDRTVTIEPRPGTPMPNMEATDLTLAAVGNLLEAGSIASDRSNSISNFITEFYGEPRPPTPPLTPPETPKAVTHRQNPLDNKDTLDSKEPETPLGGELPFYCEVLPNGSIIDHRLNFPGVRLNGRLNAVTSPPHIFFTVPHTVGLLGKVVKYGEEQGYITILYTDYPDDLMAYPTLKAAHMPAILRKTVIPSGLFVCEYLPASPIDSDTLKANSIPPGLPGRCIFTYDVERQVELPVPTAGGPNASDETQIRVIEHRKPFFRWRSAFDTSQTPQIPRESIRSKYFTLNLRARKPKFEQPKGYTGSLPSTSTTPENDEIETQGWDPDLNPPTASYHEVIDNCVSQLCNYWEFRGLVLGKRINPNKPIHHSELLSSKAQSGFVCQYHGVIDYEAVNDKPYTTKLYASTSTHTPWRFMRYCESCTRLDNSMRTQFVDVGMGRVWVFTIDMQHYPDDWNELDVGNYVYIYKNPILIDDNTK